MPNESSQTTSLLTASSLTAARMKSTIQSLSYKLNLEKRERKKKKPILLLLCIFSESKNW